MDFFRDTENAAVNSAETTPAPQTDPVLKVQPRKRVSARDIMPAAGDPSQGTAADEPTSRTRIKMAAPLPNTEILAIDDELGVQTELEKARDKFLDLIESLKTGRYLTDRIQGVEKHSDGGMPRAVIYHGDYKVILMASMVVELPRDLRDREPNEMYLYMLQKRLG